MLGSLGRMFRKEAGGEPAVVTVYSRAGCGCCHKAMAVLEDFQNRYHLQVHAVDVDGSPELAQRYGTEVPVVVIAEKVRFRGQVNPAMLERLLRAEGVARR